MSKGFRGAAAIALTLLFCTGLMGCRGFTRAGDKTPIPGAAVLIRSGDPFGENIAFRIKQTRGLKKVRVVHADPGLAAEDKLRVLAEDGYSVVVAGSPAYRDDLTIVAPDFPETAFVIFDAAVEGDNIASVRFDYHDAFVQAGALSAIATSLPLPEANPEKIVAWIGSTPGGVQSVYEAAFRRGAFRAVPGTKVIALYTSVVTEGHTVRRSVESLVYEAIGHGADIICLGDPALVSAAPIRSAAPGTYFIGSVLDWTASAPGKFLASVIPYPERVLQIIGREVLDGGFLGSERRFGRTDEATGLTPLRGLSAAEQRLLSDKNLDDATRAAITGQILAYRRAFPPDIRQRLRLILDSTRKNPTRGRVQ